MTVRKAAAVLLALAASIAPAASSAANVLGVAPSEFYEVVSNASARLADEMRVRANGGQVISSSTEATLVRLTPGARSRVESAIDGYIREPVALDVRPESFPTIGPIPEFGPTIGDQVALVNADEWHADGFDGDGVSIGIIDFFDVTKYWDEAEHGPTPVAGVDARCFELGDDCTKEFFRGGEKHGAAIVEIIRDMAPAADIYLGQATTINDYFALIDWFASKGVTIISRSVGSRYDGPGDGRGELNAVAAHAVSKGIFWVNSGGNNAEKKYYRHQVRLVGNRVAFGASGSETFLEFSSCISLGGVRWANDWDKPAAQRTNYDVFIWRSPIGDPGGGSVIASSTDKQRLGAPPLELIFGEYCNTSDTKLYLEVRWNGGDVTGDILEILDYHKGMVEHTQRAFSASTSVVDSNLAGVVGVGAVDPAPSGTIASYSSQGPTNDGRIAPAVSAPAGFATKFEFFAGTSASAAVVSGGAALLQSAGLADDPTSLGNLVRNTTIDRGDVGPDNRFGYGEFRLPAPPSGLPIDQTPSKFVGVDTPTRLLDTRTETAVGPPELIGNPWPGKILDLQIAGLNGLPPTGITAVAVNIVSVAPDRPSFVQAFPKSRATVGEYSSINNDSAGGVRSNFAIIPLGDDGKISIYSTASSPIVVDLLGTFQATAGKVTAGRFVELETAERLLDTRVDAPIGPIPSLAVRGIRFPAGIDSALIDALVVTVTVTQASDPGWVQAYPIDRAESIGETSTVNIVPGETVANASIVSVGSDQMAVTAFFADNGSGHIIVDAVGYITSEAALESTDGRFVAVRPNRAYDSRPLASSLLDGEVIVIDGSDAPGVIIPSSASSVVWNVAIVGANRPGFVRAWANGEREPTTSSLNWSSSGETRAAAVLSPVINGRAQFRIEDGSANLPGPVGHLIADVFGYFT